jgi:hypothetical protein
MRNRSPKMLVFPSLGSQAEAAQNRPRDSGCPWNNTLYPENPDRSIYFSQLYLTLPSPLPKASGQQSWPAPSKTRRKFKIRSLLVTAYRSLPTDHWPPSTDHRSRYPSHRGFLLFKSGKNLKLFTPANASTGSKYQTSLPESEAGPSITTCAASTSISAAV